MREGTTSPGGSDRHEQAAARGSECRFTPAWQPGVDANLQRAGKQPSAAQDRIERALTMLHEHAASLDPESFVSEIIAVLENHERPDGRNEWFDLRPNQEDGYWNSRTYWTRMRQRIHLCTCWVCWLEELGLRGC